MGCDLDPKTIVNWEIKRDNRLKKIESAPKRSNMASIVVN
jgi:hypothetical protein